jgi:hypothetical protein
VGQWINGVLPIRLIESKDIFKRKGKALPGLLDCYEIIHEDNDKRVYEIKADILFPRFKQYFIRLESIFKDEDDDRKSWMNDKWDRFDEIAKTPSIENFIAFLKENERGGTILYGRGFASTYTLDIAEHITLIDGSYKAWLEVYTTLKHMDKLIRLAFPDEPLAKATLFTVWG